jgi:amino acid transporter
MSTGSEPSADLGQFGYREQLRRALSTRDLVVYGLVFMVPIAPFAIYGFVYEASKGMVPLAYLIGLIGMLFTALSYAAMSRAFPVAGSVYAYAQRGLHEIAGFLAGWLILLDYILIPALLYLVSAVALQPLLPGVPLLAWVIGFIVFNAGVNLLGIQFTNRVNWYMLVLEFLTLALFVGIALYALYHGQGAGRLTLGPVYDPRAFSLATVVGATSIAVLSFLGFDGISTLAEESRGGQNSIGRATVLSLLLVAGLFMLQTWVATDLAYGTPFASTATAFYEICDRAGGHWLRLIVIVVNVLASGVANAMAAQAAVSRMLFAMARDRKLPPVLARIHPRYRTPYISTLLVAGLSLIVAWCFKHQIDLLADIVNFGALSSFLLLHLAVIRHFLIRGRSGRWGRHMLCPLAGFAVIAYVLFEMNPAAKVIGGVWLVIGIVYYAVLTGVLKRSAALEV